MSRLRFMVTDDSADSPGETRVLFRQRVGWVALLGAYLAVLCLPAHRAMIMDQASRALLGKKPGWMTATNGDPGTARSALQATARKFPSERDVQIGAVLLHATPEQQEGESKPASRTPGLTDPRVRAAAALIERFPNDPVAIAQPLRYFWVAGGLRRRAAGDKEDGVRISASDLDQIERWCREGARLDSQNGYFPSMLAAARFGAGQDEAALEALHAASVCETWKDYAYAEGSGARALLIRAFGDRGLTMHALPMAGVLLPHLHPLRTSMKLGVWHAEQKGAAGDREAEHRLRADVIRLGSLMRRNADTLIARLVGAAAEDFGYGVGEPARGAFAKGGSRSKRADARHSYVQRLEREAPQYAAEVERERKLMARFDETKDWYLGDSPPFKAWDNLINGELRRDITGLTVLPNLGVSLLLWAAAAALALLPWKRKSDDGWSAGSLIAVLGIAGLAFVPFVMSNQLVQWWHSQSPAVWLLWSETPTQGSTELAFWVPTGALLALIIPASVLIVTVVRRRNLWQAANGMRLAFKISAAVLATLYLGYVLIAVPTTARDARTWDRIIARETSGDPI